MLQNFFNLLLIILDQIMQIPSVLKVVNFIIGNMWKTFLDILQLLGHIARESKYLSQNGLNNDWNIFNILK